jgi:type VI secretion system protein ImpI
MELILQLVNETTLPDGGPVSCRVTGKRNVDIGRAAHLDWTLPDPSRFISGKHCEIHFRDNSYWLNDVSTNGTFLNGAEHRMRSPHQLRNGDRLIIGHYIIVVSVDGQAAVPGSSAGLDASAPQRPAVYGELWNSSGEAPPPIDRQQIMTAKEAARPVNPDFLDWAAAVPEADLSPARSRPSALARVADPEDDWTGNAPQRPAAAPPAAPLAAPRRPVWRDDEAGAGNNPFRSPQPKPAPAALVDTPPAPPSTPLPLPSQVQSAPLSADMPGAGVDSHEFACRVARAAGLPEDFFAGKDPQQLADQLGELMRLSVGNVMSLLQARNEAKRMTRSTSQTMIQATENNPLKFSPTAEDAIRLLFGPKSHSSYLDGRRAFEQAFHDLKTHQIKTYAAMQHAVTMLVAHVDPTAVVKDAEGQEGLLDRLQSRKARLWDAFVARWKASYGREKGAAIEAFMLHFADHYDQDDRTPPR